jgi:hypothetical protein
MCTTQTRWTGADGRGLCQLVPTKPSEASPSAAMIAPVLRPVSSWTISTCMLCSPSHKQVVSNTNSTRPFSHCIAFAINPLDVPFFFVAHQTSLGLDSILYIAHPALHPHSQSVLSYLF